MKTLHSHDGNFLWSFELRRNKNGTSYWACQYVVLKDGEQKTVTRGLGIKDTGKYKANLSKHKKIAKESFKERLRCMLDDI